MKLHLPVFLRKSLLSCLSAVIVCTVGSGAAWAEALSFEGESLTWDTQTEFFTNEDKAAAAFTAGDNVSFTGESAVTLGEDISAGTVVIEKDADVTIDLDVYELNVDRIELSGSLDVGDSLSIGKGASLVMTDAGAVLDSNLVLGEEGVLSVTGAGGSLGGHSLTLQEGASLILTGAVISRETTDVNHDGELSLIVTPTGDGKTYTLLTGVSELVDKYGNSLTVGSYSTNELFDSSLPGSGFWTGGTLVYASDGTLTLVLHNETVKEAITITSRQTYPSAYQYYAGIAFEDISYDSDSSVARGGAIYGSSITLSNNGSVSFTGNSAFSSSSPSYSNYSARGGAIYGSSITLSDNGSVVFEGNTASFFYSAEGGAIYGYSASTITLSGNGSVTFIGNTASSSNDDAYGGAIYGYRNSTITLSNNGSVVFEGNTASASSDNYARGGAIYGDYYSTITLSDNGSVTFSGNTASGRYAYGGAIYGGWRSTITLSDNGSVTFSGNTASSSDSSAYGGAIYGYDDSSISLSNNESVTFSGNVVSSSSYVSGGAIYGSVTMEGNGAVSFSGNTASSADDYAYGGAIDGGSISLSNNESVTFSGNTASVSSYSSYSYSASGGAIVGSAVTMTGNGAVSFSGNTASASSSARGGAIYASGNLSIRNNESVLFEKNVEKSGSSYRLRSIYADGSGDAISLSAAVGKSIEFRDSVYIASGSTVNLNADYTYQDEAGESVTIRQTGDIIFTGADTEQHLNDLLEAAGAVRTATAQEILNSRTTEVNTLTNLYGGRLRVEDGAIYQGQGIMVHEGSEATVLVKDATLNHDGCALTFNAGTTLQVEGESLIVGDVLLMAQSVLHLEGETTINGAITLGLGMQLAGNILTEVQKLQLGESLTLVSGLESLAVQPQNLMRSVEYTTVMDGYEVQASEYFSNLAGNTGLVMRYDGEAGTVSITQTMAVPEPAAATLGLLALAALAVRRRRK